MEIKLSPADLKRLQEIKKCFPFVPGKENIETLIKSCILYVWDSAKK